MEKKEIQVKNVTINNEFRARMISNNKTLFGYFCFTTIFCGTNIPEFSCLFQLWRWEASFVSKLRSFGQSALLLSTTQHFLVHYKA